ncbi:MAG: HEPN family nuclease [Anaerolineales bacterium]|nr:HEPN family nuclease [Anaerolineales bacterium]
MSEIMHFETEFVQRTRHILRRYRGKYKLSNVINCTLGLIILPNEMLNHSQNPIWEMPIGGIPEINNLRIRRFEPIKKKKRSGEIENFPKTLKIFLKKVRNGLAHQNIEPVNTNRIFTGIIIRNYYGEGTSDLDLEIEFNREELEGFALFIAEKYLEN